MNPEIAYEETAQCRFPADLRCIRSALDKLRTYCRGHGLRPNLWNQVELAVAEGLNNAVEHGCAGVKDAQVTLSWTWSGELLSVWINDPGSFLPPPAEAKLPDDILAESGRGEFIMASVMDRVEHKLTDKGHLVELVKTVGPQSWQMEDAAEMEATIESMTEELSRSYEDVAALFRFAEELATSTSLLEFLDRSFERLLGLVTAQSAFIRLVSADGISLELIGPTPAKAPWVERLIPLDSAAAAATAFKTGQPVTVENCAKLPPSDPLHHHEGSAFACPIFFRSTPLGCLVVTRSVHLGYFSAGELGLIRVIADFLGIVRTTNLLQEQRQAQQRALRELEIASAIQQSLLPRMFPDDANYRICGVCQSAQEVGGDYFDALSLPRDGILLVIADVMGKGVPAALLATVLRTAIHARLDLARRPDLLLTEVNRQIAKDLAQVDMFITAQVAYLSCKENTLLLVNAGHCPLIHCRAADGQALQLHGNGIPLGVIPAFEYRADRYTIASGDRLVFLTDGLYEVENDCSQPLGIEALVDRINRERSLPPAEFCSQILRFVREYSGRTSAADDHTLLTVDRIPN